MSQPNESLSHYGIFWDIENIPIPAGKLASNVVSTIKRFIQNLCTDCKICCAFCCACDTRKLDDRVVEGLNRSGVDILHVNSRNQTFNSKVDADSKLKENIDQFVVHHNHNHNSTLFVISGDVDFAPAIRSALRNGIKVVLLYGLNTSQDLKNLVPDSHSFYDIISDKETNSGNAIQSNNNDMVVTTSRLPQVGRHSSGSGMTSSHQLHSVESRLNNGSQSSQSMQTQEHSQHSLPSFVSDVVQTIQQTSRIQSNADNNHRQSQRSMQSSIRNNNPPNNDNSEEFSTEFMKKIEIIQTVTGVERYYAIRILQICSGNVEQAIDSLYEN